MPENKPAEDEPPFDWTAFDAQTPEDIDAAIARDPDAPPVATEESMKNAKLRMPKTPPR